MDEKIKKSNRDRKVAARRKAMPVNGLGYVRLVQAVMVKKGKETK